MKCVELKTAEEILDLVKHHNKASKPVAIDTETTGLDPWNDKITDVVLTGKTDKEVCYFGGEHVGLLLQLHAPTIWQNFKFDFEMAYRAHNVDLRELKGEVTDIMLLDHLADENREHGLDAMVQREYKDDYKERFWSRHKDFIDAPVQEQVNYMCRDVWYTALLYYALTADLENQHIPRSLSKQVHDLARCLYDTEIAGVSVDVGYACDLGVELQKDIKRLEQDMRQACDLECRIIENELWAVELGKRKTDRGKAGVQSPVFNFGSSKQVISLLYSKLGLPPQLNPKTKTLTKDDSALTRLVGLHPIVSLMRESSKVNKMYSAFVKSLIEKQRDGKVYPKSRINGTVTGRISIADPNVQQMPAKGKYTAVRGIIIPSQPDYVIGTCDYSQLEIALAAHYSNDPVLLAMVRNKESMHERTAKATGLTKDQAKKMNFTVLYGGSEFKVSQDLGCSIEKAKQYLDMLWREYAGLKTLIDDCHYASDQGQAITSCFGRKRHFNRALDFKERSRARRQSFNSLIQGTGADITHCAFVRIAKYFTDTDYGRALFPVHDEIVYECYLDKFEEATKAVKGIMEQVAVDCDLRVPLVANPSEALKRWAK